MEKSKKRYVLPNLGELDVNAIEVLSGASDKIDQVGGDVDETETL